MSICTLILGESGTGKTASLRNLKPADTLLIQALRKPLPFRAPGWGYLSKETPSGNIVVTDDATKIIAYMQKTVRKIVVLDDFVYVLSNEFMRRSAETGYQKFTDLARGAWDIFQAALDLPGDVRVYVLTHTQTDDHGRIKIKTIGKMLDEKIVLEGMVTIVLRTQVRDEKFWFTTQNSGNDTVKSPMGLFDIASIPNDLAEVDSEIVKYYGIIEKRVHAEVA